MSSDSGLVPDCNNDVLNSGPNKGQSMRAKGGCRESVGDTVFPNTQVRDEKGVDRDDYC